MDEPFSALDAITRDDMNIVLLELWERYRKTVLFVTHSIREAVLLSDRVLVMGKSPAKIIAEVKVPFARPRGFAIGETSQFNELCANLRNQIEIARHARYEAYGIVMMEERTPAVIAARGLNSGALLGDAALQPSDRRAAGRHRVPVPARLAGDCHPYGRNPASHPAPANDGDRAT